jgi:hypothetical protein
VTNSERGSEEEDRGNRGTPIRATRAGTMREAAAAAAVNRLVDNVIFSIRTGPNQRFLDKELK